MVVCIKRNLLIESVHCNLTTYVLCIIFLLKNVVKGDAMTLTDLRKNIYSVFEEIIETGKAVEIKFKGKSVIISPEPDKSKAERLKDSLKHKAISGDPDDLINSNWEKEWHPEHI